MLVVVTVLTISDHDRAHDSGHDCAAGAMAISSELIANGFR